METRKLKKVKEEIVPGPSFEEVTVKEEPQDVLHQSVEFHAEEGTASTSRKRTKAVSSTNTPNSPDRQSSQQPKTSVRMKNRYTQVIPEDIDLANIMRFNQLERLGGDKPIDPTGFDEIVPQCRLCLRRVSRENLEIIVRKHKKKAKVAFQIRIFPHDAYPFICLNCLSLMDIFIEFKNAVTHAKSLLVNERAYLESDGWDDPDFVDALKKCKQVVELHRKQIDSMYEENSKPQKKENEDCVGGKVESDDNVENDAINEPVDESTIQPECIITEDFAPSHSSNADKSSENIKQDVEEVAQSATVDSMDVDSSSEDKDFNPEDKDFNPEDEEEDDEDYNPKVKKLKIRKLDTHARKPPALGYKQVVSKQLCDFCGASVRPESVESHKNRHLGVRPYVCSVAGCGLTFLSRYLLSRHNKRFHSESGVLINTCNICGKQIRGSVADLKQHQKRHNIDQKNHICLVCGKGFTMKWYLTQHSIIHSGEFPHKCKYCGKKFNNKWSMKTHEKNIHEKKNQVPIEEKQTWDPESVPQVEQQPNT
ncbi:zinc finger and BTB domain-containing protein 14-like isoform X1 [Ochlerotatus camptorhynchus]|uniref:zinc finger and BTB domain-containing protein 14-like isoform X1 n=1 Tax=Ochlerotatus camptorhynchus TaxID=644619 RepID=UPI0031DF078A